MTKTNGTTKEKPSKTSAREMFLQRVEVQMRRLDLTQKELARAIGRAQSTVSDYFAPGIRALPDGEAMLKMPDALGVNGDWLLTGRGSPHRPGAAGAVSSKEELLKSEGALDVIRKVRATLLEAELRLGVKSEP